jgi:hypothetical protein
MKEARGLWWQTGEGWRNKVMKENVPNEDTQLNV